MSEVVNTPEKSMEVVNTPEKCMDTPSQLAGSEAETEVTPEKSVKAESRAEHASSAPKRPVVPYFQYMNANRTRLMAEFGLKVTEVPKKAKELFDALPAEERQVFDQQYQEQKKAYDAYMASDEGQKLAEERKKQKEIEKMAEEKKKMLRKKAAVKNVKNVKRPPTPVEQFYDERRAQIIEDVKKGDVKKPGFQVAAEAKKKAQELFDALPDAERRVYESRHVKQMKAFESLKDAEKKALQEYKATVRKSIIVPKEPKVPKERKRAEKASVPRAAKKAKKNEETEAIASPDVAAKAAEMGLAESGVSYVSLLEKLLRTPGLQGNVSDEKALTLLKKNSGNLNLSRNEIKGGA